MSYYAISSGDQLKGIGDLLKLWGISDSGSRDFIKEYLDAHEANGDVIFNDGSTMSKKELNDLGYYKDINSGTYDNVPERFAGGNPDKNEIIRELSQTHGGGTVDYEGVGPGDSEIDYEARKYSPQKVSDINARDNARLKAAEKAQREKAAYERYVPSTESQLSDYASTQQKMFKTAKSGNAYSLPLRNYNILRALNEGAEEFGQQLSGVRRLESLPTSQYDKLAESIAKLGPEEIGKMIPRGGLGTGGKLAAISGLLAALYGAKNLTEEDWNNFRNRPIFGQR